MRGFPLKISSPIYHTIVIEMKMFSNLLYDDSDKKLMLITFVVIMVIVLVNWLPCATSLSPPLVMEMMTDALLQAKATAPPHPPTPQPNLRCALCHPPCTASCIALHLILYHFLFELHHCSIDLHFTLYIGHSEILARQYGAETLAGNSGLQCTF